MAGRKSPALFELIRDPGVNRGAPTIPVTRQARQVGPASTPAPAVAEPKPRIQVVPKPAPPRDEPKPEPRTESPSSRAPSGPRKPITLSQSALFMGVAGFLVLVLAVWWIAYRSGYSAADQKALRDLGLGAGAVKDPLKGSDVPLNPKLLPNAPVPSPTNSQKKTAGTPKQAPGKTAVIPQPPAQPASGPLADTRQVGLNYCVAAGRLDKEGADRAANFLVQNGVPAIVVVDSAASKANNPNPYKVVALQGITGKEYASRADVRTKLEADLVRLGQVYKKDPKGRVDFGQFAWEKLKE